MPTSQAQAAELAARFLTSVNARSELDGQGVSGSWDAGWKRELSGCHLRMFHSQAHLTRVDADRFDQHVSAVARHAAALRPRAFGRVLAVACVAAEEVSDDLSDLSRFQLVGKSFVTPLIIDLGSGRARSCSIGGRGIGFNPFREQVFRGLLGPSCGVLIEA